MDFPAAWKVQSEAERPEAADGAAVLEQGGRQLGKISVVLKYADSRDADTAVASALGEHELQVQIKGFKDVSVGGADDGYRIDYAFKSAGTGATPPKGELVNGVDVVGTVKRGETLLVRINAVSADELEKAIGEGATDIAGDSEGKPNVDGRTLLSASKNPYARLLHDSAISTKTVHSVDVDNKEGGFELKAGLSLGYTTKMDSETAELEKAEFLGAPAGQDGSRSFMPIDACS